MLECIRSRISSWVRLLVNSRLAHCGVAHAAAMVNGAALEVALRVAGVRPNTEVLFPAYVCCHQCLSHLNAVLILSMLIAHAGHRSQRFGT